MLKRLFNPDNPIFSWINKVVDLAVLSILWTVCSLPILTIGTSSAALYYAVVTNIRRREGYAAAQFFKGFKENLKKSFLANLVMLLLGAGLLFADFPVMMTFYGTGSAMDTVLFVLLGVKLLIYLGGACWLYPLISRFDEKMLKLGESTVYLAFRYFHITVLAALILALAAIILIDEWLLLFIIPGVVALLMSFLMEPIFEKINGDAEQRQ